jgi:hypothetical protein
MNKTTSILKSIVMGLIFGSLVFFMPFFLLKVFIFFMVISFFMKMMWWRVMSHGGGHYLRYAEKVRNMSDDEFSRFKSKGYRSCQHYDDYTEVKQEKNANQSSTENK